MIHELTGIEPTEYKVLIQVDEVKDKSAGGILLPESAISRDQTAHDRGILVATSEAAFLGEAWPGVRPKAGDRVIFNKYAGSEIKYKPERNVTNVYRLCNDKDVCAILRENGNDRA